MDHKVQLGLEKTMRKWSRKKILLSLAVILLALWSLVRFWPAPADKNYTRPKAVYQTPYEQRDLYVKGIRLRYIDVGPRQGEAFILLPGHTSRIEEYRELVPKFAEKFRVLVFDFPGSGYSEKPERSYTLEFYEDTVIAFMDALGISQAHLGGGSQGGNVTLGVAARYPERFDRLVPWSPGSAWPKSPLLARSGWLISGYLPFWPMIRFQSTFWMRKGDAKTEKALKETFQYYDEVMGPGFIRMYWGIALDTVRRSLFDVAPKVKNPTLLCWGDQDGTPYMAEGIQKIKTLLPRCEGKVFPGSPHSLASDVPEKLGDAILEFLTREKEKLP